MRGIEYQEMATTTATANKDQQQFQSIIRPIKCRKAKEMRRNIMDSL